MFCLTTCGRKPFANSIQVSHCLTMIECVAWENCDGYFSSVLTIDELDEFNLQLMSWTNLSKNLKKIHEHTKQNQKS